MRVVFNIIFWFIVHMAIFHYHHMDVKSLKLGFGKVNEHLVDVHHLLSLVAGGFGCSGKLYKFLPTLI